MSNKIVPEIYRRIIDDVIANVTVDFDEYGMEEEVLLALQAKWEAKLLETKVADFVQAAPPSEADGESDDDGPANGHGHNNAVRGSGNGHANGNQYALPGRGSGSEGNEAFGYTGAVAAGQLALPGMGMGMGTGNGHAAGGLALPGVNGVQVKQEDDPLRLRGGAPSEYDDVKPKAEPNAAGLLPGDEVIDSDLDDSDDEGQGEGEGDVDVADIVFCVYDKVARVKNKWKATFKDGLVHINGRDYLFTKCMGEFEW